MKMTVSVLKILYEFGFSYSKSVSCLRTLNRGTALHVLAREFCDQVDDNQQQDQMSQDIEYQKGSIRTSNRVLDGSPVSSKEIQNFLKGNVAVKEGFTNYIATCPRHTLVQLNIAEVNNLFINKKTGYFVCKSCKMTGPWELFEENTNHLISLAQERKSLPAECIPSSSVSRTKSDMKKVHSIWELTLPIEDLQNEEFQYLQNIVGIEVLTKETLTRFGVKVLSDKSGFVLPLFNGEKELAGIRVLSVTTYTIKEQERKRAVSKILPNNDCNGLFGLNLINRNDHEVILTANEFDAMAVYQQLGSCAIALPKGRTMLHQELLPHLEQFSKITVWLGGDQQVWEKAVGFTKKLNQERCFLIRPSRGKPNALKALQKRLDLKEISCGAKSMMHKSIVSFQSLRHEVFQEISEADKLAGVKWRRYPVLNNILKGHRRGELTVFTGPTGAGKTTFISDYSLDLCMQGVNTLWGSFEINNVRLLKTMLTQFAQKNLVKNLDEFDYWADQFEQLPMYFMTFHGQQNVNNVIETMSHAAYVYDIAHVIVDNLQFMMGTDSRSEDRFLRQDQLISSFRKFATAVNCHVTLVIHPRKEKEEELTVSSIFGGAKATQEADNVILLQDKRLTSLKGRKYIQIAKNRFDGELGIMLLQFNKDSLSYSFVKNNERKKHNL